MSPHIALREAELLFSLEKVDFAAGKKLANGQILNDVSPKGSVPALILDNGELLTEGAVIVQYIADQRPEKQLAPRAGTFERVRLNEWLNFIATELHKQFSPLFYPTTPDAVKDAQREKIGSRFDLISKTLEKQPFLLGAEFSVADAYLFNMLRWTEFTGIDRAKWPVLVAFFDRVSQRPAVQAALEAEKNAK
jgi:glutathione S-transferase